MNRTLAIIWILFVFVSCKKEDNQGPCILKSEQTPNGNTRYYNIVDGTVRSITGNGFSITYQYNSAKRVTTITGKLNGNPSFTDTYSYTSSGHISQVVSNSNYGPPNRQYLFSYQNDKPVRIIMLSSEGKSVFYYRYENDNLIDIRQFNVENGQEELFETTTYTYTQIANPFYGMFPFPDVSGISPYALASETVTRAQGGYSVTEYTHVTNDAGQVIETIRQSHNRTYRNQYNYNCN